MTLVCRANAAALWDPSLADKDVAAAASAERHIVRLRAELKAVSAARDAVKEEMNSLLLSRLMLPRVDLSDSILPRIMNSTKLFGMDLLVVLVMFRDISTQKELMSTI